MIRSMTAFARRQVDATCGSFLWEVRTVNHRFLDLSFKLPEALRASEMDLRAVVQGYMQRGRVEVYLRYQPLDQNAVKVTVNIPLVNALGDAYQQVASLVQTKVTNSVLPLDATRLLSWPTLIQIEDVVQHELQKVVISSFEETLKELVNFREREGAALKKIIESRFDAIRQQLTHIKIKLPQALEAQRLLILTKFEEAKVTLEPTRLEQEMVLLAQKSDTAEEIDRLETHISEAAQALNDKQPVGRRLDFLLQEMNREINTLGAKSVFTDISKAVVEIKVLLEQIREQVQNIE